MTNINIVPGGKWDGLYPVSLDNFTSNSNCQFLRDIFATYDKYFDSMMIKYPCGEGGTIAEFPSGKENTYKLADCTFYNSRTKEHEILYLAANKAASIDVRGPKLTTGNWWLPSTAEFVQIMRNITFWEGKNIDNKTDIINRVINKLRNVDTNWDYLYANKHRWTSSRYDQLRAYNYDGNHGGFYCGDFHYGNVVTPITIYEF